MIEYVVLENQPSPYRLGKIRMFTMNNKPVSLLTLLLMGYVKDVVSGLWMEPVEGVE